MTNPETAPVTTVPEDDAAYRAELLSRAALMNLPIHPMAKNSTIAAKIAAALADKPDPEKKDDAPEVGINDGGAPLPPDDEPAPLSKTEKELHPSKRLHRVIVTCNDPQKADQTGDIIQVSNYPMSEAERLQGHVLLCVHSAASSEIVLETLKESKLFLHSSRKDGREVVTREVPRYNIQYLPALTEKERHRIADKQSAALATED